MPIDPVPDHVADGVALFIDQYKNKPRLTALLTAFLSRCNELETAFGDTLTKRSLDYLAPDGVTVLHAAGAQLDTLGALVGQPRISTDDEIYRLYIRTRIVVNRSRATPEDIIAVAQAFLGAVAFEYEEFYPASVVVNVLGALSFPADVLADFVAKSVGAGITSSVHFASAGQDTAFRYAPGDVAVQDTAHGYGNDAGTVGGLWIGAF